MLAHTIYVSLTLPPCAVASTASGAAPGPEGGNREADFQLSVCRAPASMKATEHADFSIIRMLIGSSLSAVSQCIIFERVRMRFP